MKRMFGLSLLLAVVSVAAGSVAEKIPQEFVGEWDAYIVNHGEKNLLADDRFSISTDGIVETITPGSAKRRIPGRLIYHRRQLILLLPETKRENSEETPAEKRGLIADCVDETGIEFRNEFQPDLVFRLERRHPEQLLTAEWLVGTWSLVQKNFKTGEERVAPFKLVFSPDGNFSFAGKGAETLNAEYAGSCRIENNRLFLENQCETADSLWFQTVFFRDRDHMVLNRLDAFICAKRDSAPPQTASQ